MSFSDSFRKLGTCGRFSAPFLGPKLDPGHVKMTKTWYPYISKLPEANVPLRALKDGVQEINYFLLKYVRHSLGYRDLADQQFDFQFFSFSSNFRRKVTFGGDIQRNSERSMQGECRKGERKGDFREV